MNRRQSTTVALSVAAIMGLSSLAACGSSSSATAGSPPASVGGNDREHEAHRGVDEGSIVQPGSVKPSEHLAHQGR